MNRDERAEMFAKRLLDLGIELRPLGAEAAFPTREENARWLAEKILNTFELERGRAMEVADMQQVVEAYRPAPAPKPNIFAPAG